MTDRVAADNLAGVDVQAQHVAGVEKAEVLANRVHPNQLFVLWVADTDVSRDPFNEAIASPAAHHCGHMCEDMLPVLGVAVESWDTGKSIWSMA